MRSWALRSRAVPYYQVLRAQVKLCSPRPPQARPPSLSSQYLDLNLSRCSSVLDRHVYATCSHLPRRMPRALFLSTKSTPLAKPEEKAVTLAVTMSGNRHSISCWLRWMDSAHRSMSWFWQGPIVQTCLIPHSCDLGGLTDILPSTDQMSQAARASLWSTL